MRKRYDGFMTTSQPVIYARCEPELHAFIVARAAAQGVSMGEAVRRIVLHAKTAAEKGPDPEPARGVQ